MTFEKTFHIKLSIDNPAALCDQQGVENEIADAALCMKHLMRRWITSERLGEPIRVGYVGEMATALEGIHAGSTGTVIGKRVTKGEVHWIVSFERGQGTYRPEELMVKP